MKEHNSRKKHESDDENSFLPLTNFILFPLRKYYLKGLLKVISNQLYFRFDTSLKSNKISNLEIPTQTHEFITILLPIKTALNMI